MVSCPPGLVLIHGERGIPTLAVALAWLGLGCRLWSQCQGHLQRLRLTCAPSPSSQPGARAVAYSQGESQGVWQAAQSQPTCAWLSAVPRSPSAIPEVTFPSSATHRLPGALLSPPARNLGLVTLPCCALSGMAPLPGTRLQEEREIQVTAVPHSSEDSVSAGFRRVDGQQGEKEELWLLPLSLLEPRLGGSPRLQLEPSSRFRIA